MAEKTPPGLLEKGKQLSKVTECSKLVQELVQVPPRCSVRTIRMMTREPEEGFSGSRPFDLESLAGSSAALPATCVQWWGPDLIRLDLL